MNHDRLMSQLHKLIKDAGVLCLIREYLNQGLVLGVREGVPQGGPLSPLLSNLYLDSLDKELEKRGHKFVRYADDIKIMVGSEKAASRVMRSTSQYLEKKLKLRINGAKSTIGKRCKFLGYVIGVGKLKISEHSIKAFKEKVRTITKIRGGSSMRSKLEQLKPLIDGWYEYFKLQETPKVFSNLDGWIRSRVRACYYSQLKNGHTRLVGFMQQGIRYDRAYRSAYNSRGAWFNGHCGVLQQILSNNKLKGMGLASLLR